MRVGIVSLFGNENMGNKLQNYALERKLSEYVDDVLTIRNKCMRKNLIKYLTQQSSWTELTLVNQWTGNIRREKLVEFGRKNICSTSKTYFYNIPTRRLKKADRCDIYCAGSDQVWNPNFGCFKMFNYLGFADRERTFSYAASFGVEQIPEQYKDAVRRGLQHIKYISVREDAGKRIVEELTGRTDVQVLVDPTMLMTTEEWDNVAAQPWQGIPDRYILTYFLGNVPQERRDAIYTRAKEMDCQVIELMDKNSPYYAIGPGEFIYLMKHAALVCTDSFHGSVFSFLYQRPLAIFDRKGEGNSMSSRLETLAAKFHLEGCMAQGECLPDLPAEANYAAGYTALAAEREKSRAFLDMVFQEAERAGLCD